MKGFALDLTVSGDLAPIRAEVVRKKSGAARPRTQACHPCPIPCLLLSLGSLFYSHRQSGWIQVPEKRSHKCSKNLRNGFQSPGRKEKGE